MVKKNDEYEQKIGELTQDLQRMRADFENYRKNVEREKETAREYAKVATVMRLLPVIDDIERATQHVPKEISENSWVKGVKSLEKKLVNGLGNMEVSKIRSGVGVEFDPELHEAIAFDEDAEGEKEVIAEELRTGYKMGDEVIRPAMVKVTRK